MRVYRDVSRLPRRARYVALGMFDGMHLGHQRIIGQLVKEAAEDGVESTVITFDPHPRSIVGGEAPLLLTTLEGRLELMESMGADSALVVNFDRAFASRSPGDFVRDFLVGDVGASKVFVGFNFRFGRGGAGDVTTLRRLGDRLGVDIYACAPVRAAGRVVSSSEIRSLVENGQVAGASLLLGLPYRLVGVVGRGDGRGKALGFPTANVQVSPDHVLPATGVYAVCAAHETGQKWHGPYLGVANIGNQPTFSGGGEQRPLRLEVHFIDVVLRLYGHRVAVDFLDRIREEKRFPGAGALAAQLQLDVAQAVRWFGADSHDEKLPEDSRSW